MARRGVNLPPLVAQLDPGAGLQERIKCESRALLAGRRVSERLRIPVGDECGLARRDQRLQIGIALLQRGISAAMVAVQVRVEQAVEWAPLQRLPGQGHGLRGMRAVTAVHQRGRVPADEQDVVGRQPAALEDGDSGRQRRCVKHSQL